MKLRYLICLSSAMTQLSFQAQELQLSFADAEARMLENSKALKIADAEIQAGRYEQRKTNAWWWPRVQANGAYAHMSEKMEVRQPLSHFTNPAKAYIQHLLPTEKLVSGLLDEVGRYTLTFPLLPQDVTSIGLTAEWLAFSGGKRMFAHRMSQQLTNIAEINGRRVKDTEKMRLVERYYGLVVAEQTEEVCRRRYEGLEKHYHDALRMEDAGLIDKAARLLAQVSMEESAREWDGAKNNVHTAQIALKQLIGMSEEETQIKPSTPLFVAEQLPSVEFYEDAMIRNNPAVSILHVEQQIAKEKLRMDQSAYLPEVALFGKQTLYAHGLPSNLLPRTVIGVGFTWNIFDGLERESKIAQTRLAQQTLVWSKEEVEEELKVTISDLYATMQHTHNEISVINSSIAFHEELLRMRRIAFAEGMATSTEVIDAENALSEVQLARITAYYVYEVALANLLVICGMTDDWKNYN